MAVFANVTNNLVRKALVTRLREVVTATQDQSKGYLNVETEKANKLFAADNTLVELGQTTDNGKTIPVRATQAGIAAIAAEPTPAPAEPRANVGAVVKSMGGIKIEKGIIMPQIRRGGAAVGVYPFEQMEIGDSFFISESAEMPKPAKTLGTAVSSATRRFKTANPPRVFTVRGDEYESMQADGTPDTTSAKGARVWRIEPKNATPEQASGDNPTAH